MERIQLQPRRVLAMLLAAILGCAVLVAVPAVSGRSAVYAASNTLSDSSPSRPMSGENFVFTFRLSSKVARPVTLQRRSGKNWKTVARSRTKSSGTGTFATKMTASSTKYRVYAPRTTVTTKKKKKKKRTTYKSRYTSQRTVYTIAQSGSLVLGAIAPSTHRAAATATFTPARSGRLVKLQFLDTKGVWRDLAAAKKQSSAGRVVFANAVRTDVEQPQVVRASASAYRGASAVSAKTTMAAAPPVLQPDPDPDLAVLPKISITTDGGASVETKDTYVPATLTVDPRGSMTKAFDGRMRIRVRGNSTAWVIKRSFKVKLDAKAEVLGMSASKSWVLLANFYDRSMLRNAVAFEIGRRFGQAWVPRMQFAEVWVNEDFQGLYQFGEGIGTAKDRVNIADLKPDATDITGGYLLEADSWPDDDPLFVTSRGLSINIKEPEDLPPSQKNYISGYVQEFENVLYSDQFADHVDGYAKYIDVDSIVDWYLVNEITKNIDSGFLNSCWMYKDAGGKLTFGPLWDFDMSTGSRALWETDDPTGWFVRHNWTGYFPDAPDVTPTQMKGPQGHWLNRLFEDPAFVAKVQTRWSVMKPQLASMPSYVDGQANLIADAADANFSIWPIGETFMEGPTHAFKGSWPAEVVYLRSWLGTRIAWMDSELAN